MHASMAVLLLPSLLLLAAAAHALLHGPPAGVRTLTQQGGDREAALEQGAGVEAALAASVPPGSLWGTRWAGEAWSGQKFFDMGEDTSEGLPGLDPRAGNAPGEQCDQACALPEDFKQLCEEYVDAQLGHYYDSGAAGCGSVGGILKGMCMRRCIVEAKLTCERMKLVMEVECEFACTVKADAWHTCKTHVCGYFVRELDQSCIAAVGPP